MIIEEIILVGYTRFNTDEIKTFRWKPQSSLSLVLGGNGSGKSSLLNELNPMPANRHDYEPGGSKTFICTLNDVRYILNSNFERGQKHSFVRITDGVKEELNSSATVTIQKELVESILRYDNKLHSLLTGQIIFTDLSPTQRKELLMSISPLDLSYVNGVFDKTRIALRDDQGALKHQVIKCSDLETRISSIEINEDSDTIKNLE